MNLTLSNFLLGLWVFLISSVDLGWFTVDVKLIGVVGIAFVVVLIYEGLRGPIVLVKNQ